MHIEKYIFTLTLFTMLVYNYPLYSFSFAHLDITSIGGILTLISEIVGLFIVTSFLLYLMALISHRFLKLFAIFSAIGNSISLYFMASYQVILNRTMMGNVLQTNFDEAFDLYHPKLLIYLFVLGVLPALIFFKIKIQKANRLRMLRNGLAVFMGGLLILYLNSSTWLWVDKYAKKIGGLTLPWSYTINIFRYQFKKYKKSKKQIQLPNATLTNSDKMVVILIIGESARADRFSLYGYPKNTNPNLQNLGVTTLTNSIATTTYTSASVHSMLSHDASTDGDHETLPNYLARNGVEVIWRSKNFGAPPLDASINADTSYQKDCQMDACSYDEVMLTNLSQLIQRSKKDKTFITLHTSGSHGPSYHKKYPKTFEKFTPVCKTVDLKQCTQNELDNAYDNTILYTDHLISQTIKLLQDLSFPSAMLYISDHGESLGENGLYLHGTPSYIAPNEQLQIPFIVWRSDQTKPSLNSKEPYGHFNIFHTVLGLLSIKSPIYDAQKDIF
jgi:lipid A ethanolaminephosphotransferase